MNGVSESWIGLLVAALFGGGVGYVLSASRRRDEAKPQRPVEAAPVHETLDIVSAWPAQVTRVLGTAQRLAHRSMVTALPEYTVLAQVPLARFLQVPRRHSYAEWLRRAGHLGADFVICDSASQVVCVVLLSAERWGGPRMAALVFAQPGRFSALTRVSMDPRASGAAAYPGRH